MKIQVVIEAESIHEYTEAIKALAAGYTVQAPVLNVVAGSQESAATVDSEAEKQKEEEVNSRFSKMAADVTEEGEDIPEEEKVEPKNSFTATKLMFTKLGKITDGKAEQKALIERFGLKKLSDLTEDQYDAFHDEAKQIIADHDNAPQKETETPSTTEDTSAPEEVETTEDDKELTLEDVRKAAKETAVSVGKHVVQAALKKFGAGKLSDVKPEDFEAFIKELQ